jgi:hypothetical protein
MAKKAISLTLSQDNLLWLRAETKSRRSRSVSETLDRLLDELRVREGISAKRSVVGMVRIDETDPKLEKADAMLRALFSRSLDKS